ncbi:alpha/beta fold hydrolase [Methylophaga sp. OBS1]|uniref:alpha/beta fold hydrolase n=1 Tax=Methylophaga sp. OBS1 TaxID=2991933 RepID=UPI002256AF18|nr:alpha/beta hydrolase [Methylophaga sp. OBS1]MCX4193481.1 alpha/beta hydrolase [Methylophaga sp. OBS1]
MCLKSIQFLLFFIAVVLLSSARANEFPPIPGERYDVGGYSIHMLCRGQGEPTVLIDAGLGDDSTDWFEIQNDTAAETRVCVFDRPGYGWSDAGPQPRNSLRISNEIEKLIQKAKIPGPFVLVGHSFGGYNIRVFAAQNPGKIAGMVLVDASHEKQYEIFDISLPQHFDRKGNILVMPKYGDSDSVLNKHRVLRERAFHAARAEISSLYESARQVEQFNQFPKVPLIVISRGKSEWLGRVDAEAKEQTWARLQQDLWKLSPISQQVFAPRSGHDIHLDQPEVVVTAITDVVTMSRVMN